MNRETKLVSFLYNNFIGRLFLKIAYNPLFSKFIGIFFNTRISAVKINAFIKKHDIDMNRFVKTKYKSFNDFFIRELKDIEIDNNKETFISPCDGNLLVYKINEKSVFTIKNSIYSIKDLLGKEDNRFNNGLCLIFRLEPKDYHRYGYVDKGVKGTNIFIKGKLHTVRNIAIEKYKVFHTNSREWTEMKTDNFGTIIQIEVGALLVGKIKNYHESYQFKKGEEKGRFEYGGSTIIMLIEKDRIKISYKIVKASSKNLETKVNFGMKIGLKL